MSQTPVVDTTNESGLQVLANNLHVNYYADFRVLECDNPRLPGNRHAKYYFPMAEVYESGMWRLLVIGGRPYRNISIARKIIEKAEHAQKVFLIALGNENQSFLRRGLVNPIDNWRYELELS